MIPTLAAQWLEETSQRLTAQGRPLEGGWPGTLSEARHRLRVLIVSENLQLSEAQCDSLSREMYKTAKNRWRDCAVLRPRPELPDDM